ncbi:hypothetical protein GY45DRAFT_1325962 [Cubamyces sp. BRFM 1775]|nr:hypothetical protein GY45DRAFT_1325962 [Cubamyces sp. BRFM 1775]
MSTTADSSALISVLTFDATLNYCGTSVVALLMYYYLTTLNEEVNHYFKRKITLATLLYTTNRYVPLAYAFYNAPLFAYSSNLKLCAAETGIESGLESLQYIPWAIFSALRTYALQRKLSWAIIVLILSLAPVIVSSVTDHWFVISEAPDDGGCEQSDNLPPWFQHSVSHRDMSYLVPVLARAPMIIADAIIVIVTWKTQYKTYSLGKKLLTAILISDFLTHLHEAADKTSNTETLASVGTLEFRIIGSIGASLPGGPDDVVEPSESEESGTREDLEWDWDGGVVSSSAEVEEVTTGETEA